MSSSALTRRLAEFKGKFQNLLGAKAQGYDELSTLDRPLMSDDHTESDDYQQRHGVPPSGYQPPRVGAERVQTGAEAPAFAPTSVVPTQVDEIREISVLSKDAAEIMWEMVAMGEVGAAMEDMKSKAEQLRAQLRGLINDYQGGDEATFAQAFECFDMLSRCLEEMKNPGQAAPAGAPTADVPSLAPPPGAPTSAPQPSAQEAPLISLD